MEGGDVSRNIAAHASVVRTLACAGDEDADHAFAAGERLEGHADRGFPSWALRT